MANTRELSQLASLINVVDENKSIGVVTSYPNANIGVGTLVPTSKVDVVGDVNVSGVITATSFVGDGSNLTNLTQINGGDFATSLSNDRTSPLSSFYKVSKTLNIGSGISITVESDESFNNLVFIRELNIHVSTGSTLHIGSGTTLVTNILNIF